MTRGRPPRRPVKVEDGVSYYTCPTCNFVRSEFEFNKDRCTRLGISSRCKYCTSERASERYRKDRERITQMEEYIAELEARLEEGLPAD